jgi:tRNA-Thr(GGU) m(6)t(6)A37 methyltransferase TsaA
MELIPIGYVSSALTALADAPRQGDEGAPDAYLDIDPTFAPALDGLVAGDDVFVFTWLHRADRATLRVHPRGDRARPETGVFATRSQDRPNPVGLHRVTIVAIDGTRVHVRPLEAIAGTPVLDIKPVLHDDAAR